MKIGILAYRQYPYISANTSIAYTLGEYISTNTSNEVVYIGRMQDEAQKEVSEYNRIPICFFNEEPKDTSDRLTNYIRRFFGNGCGCKEEVRSLRNIIEEQKIDALVCVIAPADDLYIVHEAKLSIPVAVYQLDPFYHVNDTVNFRLKNDFMKIIAKPNIVRLFTTDLLYKEYCKDNSFKDILGKTEVLQFPKLKEPERCGVNNTDANEITLLYAGSLYRKIRNPEILIKLSDTLPENARVVFCGGCDNSEDFERLQSSKVECKGYLDQDKLAEEYEKADILINIGNLVKNQLGSKIVDYISTGKPIVNISQIENCPTVPVLESYSLKLNLSKDELGKAEAKIQIKDFIYETKDKSITFDEIKNLYKEYTPEYVSNRILQKLTSFNSQSI